MQAQLVKLQKDHAKKVDMDGSLQQVDYEQLEIQHRQGQEKLDKHNAELVSLKTDTGIAVQARNIRALSMLLSCEMPASKSSSPCLNYLYTIFFVLGWNVNVPTCRSWLIFALNWQRPLVVMQLCGNKSKQQTTSCRHCWAMWKLLKMNADC